MTSTNNQKHRTRDNLHVDELNLLFGSMTPQERVRELYHFYDPSEILFTSSFGTKSIFLIDLIHSVNPGQIIYFVDTGYHFDETQFYKQQIEEKYNVRIITIFPERTQHELTRDEQWWINHPKMCCTINKIAPLEPIISNHIVWISGLMASQTKNRSRMQIFQPSGEVLKFHPIIDVDETSFNKTLNEKKLLRHPLEKIGYGSIGCSHCTVKGCGRSGRWSKTNQEECGLHVKYFHNKVYN